MMALSQMSPVTKMTYRNPLDGTVCRSLQWSNTFNGDASNVEKETWDPL